VELLDVMLIIALIVVVAVVLVRLSGIVDHRRARQRNMREVYLPIHLILHRSIVLAGKSAALDVKLLKVRVRRVIKSKDEQERGFVEKDLDTAINRCAGFFEDIRAAITFDHQRIKQLPRDSRTLICNVRHGEWFLIDKKVGAIKRELENLRVNLYTSGW
jgi:biopolymer transport protein ExbD